MIRRGARCRRCNPRGGSWAQAQFRRRTLALTGGRCAPCGSAVDEQAHHRPAVVEGGADATVGEPLCRACHRSEHRAR